MRFVEKLLRSTAFVAALIVAYGATGLVPLFRGDPSIAADPAKYLVDHFGSVAIVCFIVVLCFSPLRALLPRSTLVRAINRHRRLTGVSAFVFACLHLGSYVAYKGGFTTEDFNAENLFIWTGAAAFVLLLAMAATSNGRAVKRLGFRRWKNLHRLAYPAAFLLAFHQGAQEKEGFREALWHFSPLALLQAARVALYFRKRRGKAARARDGS